jgi:lysophospholipase L1-like esterase
MFCRVTAIFFCLVVFIETNAQVGKTRIACIGNSITAGARVADPGSHSYPAVLSAILQREGYSDYQVRNFGIGGATMIKFGTPNLWSILDSLRAFVPDVVIIKAGTNETVSEPRFNWEHIGDFEKDYTAYIEALRNVNPRCKLILCSPLDMVIQTSGLLPERVENLTQRRPRIWELRDRIRKIAKEQQAYFLDLTEPFKGRSDLMTIGDGVHPNKEGYEFLANHVFDFMVQKGIVVK